MENAKKLELRTKLNGLVTDFNGAIGDMSLVAMNQAREDIKSGLKEYNAVEFDEFIARVKEEGGETPLLKALEILDYPILKFKVNRENGVETEGYLEESTAQADMVEVCNRFGLPTAWQYKVETVARLFALRVAKDLECKDSDITELSAKYRMSNQARKLLHEGKDPTSNNQLVKALQELMDEVFGGIGKVNNKDLAFIREAFTKNGKERGTINIGTGRLMRNLFTVVAHNIRTGEGYRVSYKRIKEKAEQTPEQTAEAEKTTEVADTTAA